MNTSPASLVMLFQFKRRLRSLVNSDHESRDMFRHHSTPRFSKAISNSFQKRIDEILRNIHCVTRLTWECDGDPEHTPFEMPSHTLSV